MATEAGYAFEIDPTISFGAGLYGTGLYGEGIYGQSASDNLSAKRYRVFAYNGAGLDPLGEAEGVTPMGDTDVTVVRGDQLPTLAGRIVGDDGIGLDLTGCQVFFNLRPLNGTRATARSGGCIVPVQLDGVVAYDWQQGDTTAPGEYAGEFEVVFPSGRRLTVPTGGRLRVHIPDDVAEAGLHPADYATGATAGSPGTWTPPGKLAPRTVAELQADEPNFVVPSPTSRWLPGQYVQTQVVGTTGQAWWDGTAWQAGTAF